MFAAFNVFTAMGDSDSGSDSGRMKRKVPLPSGAFSRRIFWTERVWKVIPSLCPITRKFFVFPCRSTCPPFQSESLCCTEIRCLFMGHRAVPENKPQPFYNPPIPALGGKPGAADPAAAASLGGRQTSAQEQGWRQMEFGTNDQPLPLGGF